MIKLRLNDFKSFKQYLFGDSEPDWSKFYDKERNIFTPPIAEPKTLTTYQLDHYALWMVICVYELRGKPRFCSEYYKPVNRCYACQYLVDNGMRPKYHCHEWCPLVVNGSRACCGPEYNEWFKYKDLNMAYKIAHLKWRKVS